MNAHISNRQYDHVKYELDSEKTFLWWIEFSHELVCVSVDHTK